MTDFKNHYFILRHGETTWEKPDICYPADNKTSIALSDQGKKQIESVAQKLKAEKIDLIFSSDYLRARQTGQIVAKTLKLDFYIDQRLADTDIGIYYGGPKKTLLTKLFAENRFTTAPENGESWNEVKKRQQDFLNDTESKYQDKNILVIGHGDSLWLLEGIINGSDDRELLSKIFKTKEYIKKGELKKLN